MYKRQSKLWSETGRVLAIHDDFERSYLIKRHGRKNPIRRNRIFLRPLNEVAVRDGTPATQPNPPSSALRGDKKQGMQLAAPRRSERIRAKREGGQAL